MKLNQAGLSPDDTNEIIMLLYAECQTLEDVNGAPPPTTIGNPPVDNPDYIRYIRLHSIVQTFTIMSNMCAAFDNANGSTTDPCIVLAVQAGAY